MTTNPDRTIDALRSDVAKARAEGGVDSQMVGPSGGRSCIADAAAALEGARAVIGPCGQDLCAMRRADTAGVKATRPTAGKLVATRPLEVVQIDHTEVDVVVVDEEMRQPLPGRP